LTELADLSGNELTPQRSVDRLKRFVVERALPLWSTAGFDEKAGCFHERLDFTVRPPDLPRRLMVQCRQIAIYARAATLNWSDIGQPRALRAFEMLRKRYYAPDGSPGWAFSVRSDGSVADKTRDLYAHAFVIYMLAWMFRLTSDPGLLALADTTLSDIERLFAAENGPGLLSAPGRKHIREQNPHMHLLEALLALAEASGAERYLARARALVDLFDSVLADAKTGIVRETFDGHWQPEQPLGLNVIEPGHQMEWAWLLREWQRLSGANVNQRVARLMAAATGFGLDSMQGHVRSTVQENGGAMSGGSRIWPQSEAIRTLCREDPRGKVWPGLVSRVTNYLFMKHLPDRLDGGWIDQVTPAGTPAVDYMPASSLYHLAGAAIDSESALGC
jgi:mannose/cellobiose epimerase-like protein (N-acyl-D-glucosamine 2-epimerase family)